MKLTYDGVDIHSIGTVSLVGESVQYAPTDSAQKRIVTLAFRVDAWKTSFTDNRVQMKLVIDALARSDRKIIVKQEAIPSQSGSVEIQLYNQFCTVKAHDFPADINEWGVTRQQVRITFELVLFGEDTTGGAQNASATFLPAGGSSFTMGQVFTWKEQITARRYDEFHDTREHVGGTVSVSGEFFPDMSQNLATRRTTLQVIKDSWLTAMVGKNGTLTYMSFNKVVRVQEAVIDVNQANGSLVWSFTAIYSRYPNEVGYAGSEWTTTVRKDPDTNDRVLSIAGKIIAESEVTARQKLAAIVTAQRTFQSFTTGQQTKDETSSKNIASSSIVASVDVGDQTGLTAAAFIELSFNLEWLDKVPDNLSYELKIDDKEDLEGGLLTRTYSGSIVCGWNVSGFSPPGGVNSDKAYWIACQKARTLGDAKHPVQINSSLVRTDKQRNVGDTVEMVRVEFSFSYKVRGARIYAEVKNDKQFNKFGEDTETVSGFVVGGTEAAADALYLTFKTGYTHIRNETLNKNTINLQNGTRAAPSDYTLAQTWNFTATSGYNTLMTRLDFSFQAFKDKTDFSIKYAMDVQMDWTALIKRTSFQGSIWGTPAQMDDVVNIILGNVLDAFLTGLTGSGHILEDVRTIDREHINGITSSPGKNIKVDFRCVYETAINGDASIIECSVTEKIKFSGPRNIIIGVPDQEVQVQQIGTVEGRRTISGNVVAANETAALTWVKKMKIMAYGTVSPLPAAPTVYYDEPGEISITNKFIPYIDGNVRTSANQRVVEVSFSFDTIIPIYAYT